MMDPSDLPDKGANSELNSSGLTSSSHSNCESDDDDDLIDLSVLKEGYRPIPGAAYILTERLDDGRSGFGEVWKGYSDRLKHSAVFKFCKKPFDRRSRDTLLNELRLIRELDHPGIVKLEEEYLDCPIPFLRYEFVDGVDLSKLMDERFREGGAGPLTPDHAASLILKLVEILTVPHSRRLPIVHRDVKPQNILVTNYHDLCFLRELGGGCPDLS
jgi:serine/threonine protein kinase